MKVLNKKALHDYHILDSLEAGIELSGSEVRSLKSGRGDLTGSHVRILNNQIYLINANIPKYQNSSDTNYQPTRSRRLLLHRYQIDSLIGKLGQGRVSLIPISLYQKENLIKLQIAIARSKKEFDKRKVIKERDHLRRIQQELRGKE